MYITTLISKGIKECNNFGLEYFLYVFSIHKFYLIKYIIYWSDFEYKKSNFAISSLFNFF